MNIKSGHIERFEQYSKFSSLKEFNHHMEMWMVDVKKEFSKGELIGLKRLVRFAAKIPGVCNAKIGTMLKAIHEEYEGNGISRSTFKRMIQKAIALGIIEVYETERKNGSQSSNLYVFHSYPSHEPPKKEQMDHLNKTNNLSETNITNNKRTETSLDHTYTSDSVPSAFTQVVKYFYPEAKMIEEFWRMTNIAAFRHCREKENDLVIETSIASFKQLVSKIKSESGVKKPIAYYYGILNKKLEELYFEELFELGFCC